jgi:hypothetical protein
MKCNRNSFIFLFLLVIMFLIVSSCTTTITPEMKQKAESVKEATEDTVKGCEYLGVVRGIHDPISGRDLDGRGKLAVIKAKVQASSKGATHIVFEKIEGAKMNGTTPYYLISSQATGKIYNCINREKEKAVKAHVSSPSQAEIEKAKKEALAKKRQKEKAWLDLRKKSDQALKNNDIIKAITILEEANSKKLGDAEPEKMMSEIFQSSGWNKYRKKISIQEFEVAKENPGFGKFLSNSLISELSSSKRFTIVDWEEIDKVLNYIAKSQPNISTEDAKRQAMSQLGISQMYLGSLFKLGKKYYITIKILNLDLSVAETYEDAVLSEEKIKGCIAKIAKKIAYGYK